MTTLTTPELAVADWLFRHKIAFVPQESLFGGQTEAGGAKVDFYLTEMNIILRVQSYWHSLPEAMARDVLQKIHLINEGYLVVDIYESKLKVNLDAVMEAALRGTELGE